MALYKYCSANGKFIVQNLEIKVTPPNELNDPCEMRPVVQNHDPKAWARRFAKKTITSPAYYNNNILEYPQCKNFREFQSFARQNLGEMIQELEKKSPALDNDLQQEVLDLVSKKWGIVSLTVNPIQHLMWAHYADSHKGLLVEFDEANELFTHPSFLECEYNDSPAIYDPSHGANQKAVEDFARRKRTDWSYEKESRLIVPLKLCRKTANSVYLFALEPEVIISVTFGLRMPDPLKQEVSAALNRAELGHVTKWQIVEGATPVELQRIQLQ